MGRRRRDGPADGRAGGGPWGVRARLFHAGAGRALDGLSDLGIEPVGSACEAAEGVELLVVMTATPDQGEVVLFGTAENAPEDGEVGARVGTRTRLMRGGDGDRRSRRGRAVGHAASPSARWRSSMLPCPAGRRCGGRGELVTMVGGDPDAVDAAGPVLEAVSSRVVVVGPRPGTANG